MAHPMTDQKNAAPKASRKGDGAMPSKSHGSVTQHQKSGTGTQYKAKEVRVHGTDGTPMDDEHMSDSLSGKKGPNHGKSAYGKLASSTSVMSQALRRAQKKSSYP